MSQPLNGEVHNVKEFFCFVLWCFVFVLFLLLSIRLPLQTGLEKP